jgi:nicotinamide riboside transporter PnuC
MKRSIIRAVLFITTVICISLLGCEINKNFYIGLIPVAIFAIGIVFIKDV